MLDIFAWVLLLCSAAGVLYLWYACRSVERFVARRLSARPVPLRPAVTVLKPLHGEDVALAENLRSFCRQDYPRFQVVFGLAEPADPAAAVVDALRAELPQADIALVVDSHQSGANRKVSNLRNMLPSARYDMLVIADSDMRVSPEYLTAVTAPFADAPGRGTGTGLVTCLYRGVSSGGLWSDLASLHINHGFLPQAMLAERFGAGAGCFGATMVLKRATLDAAGGFDAFADTLADDHALGEAVRRLGLAVTLSNYLVDDIVAEPSLAALFRHELRWARTIRLVAPAGFLGSIITLPVPLALIAACLGMLKIAAPAMLVVALASRALTARRIDRALGVGPAPLWLLPVRDLLSFAVFVASFLGRSVAWRDHKFRISPNGRMTVDTESPI